MAKITLLAEKMFIIRSTKTKPDGVVDISYYESPSVWNRNPAFATIFQDYDIGEAHLYLYKNRDSAKLGWADGSQEVLEVVPMYGALMSMTPCQQ